MIIGSTSIGRVVEESVCRSSKDYYFTEISDYKIHSTSLMPYIPFEEAYEFKEAQNDTIFLNDEDTKLTIPKTIDCQNYLTAGYVGRKPLEYYGPPTTMGREFILICKNSNPSYSSRAFGTESAIKGYNENANDNVKLPTS